MRIIFEGTPEQIREEVKRAFPDLFNLQGLIESRLKQRAQEKPLKSASPMDLPTQEPEPEQEPDPTPPEEPPAQKSQKSQPFTQGWKRDRTPIFEHLDKLHEQNKDIIPGDLHKSFDFNKNTGINIAKEWMEDRGYRKDYFDLEVASGAPRPKKAWRKKKPTEFVKPKPLVIHRKRDEDKLDEVTLERLTRPD